MKKIALILVALTLAAITGCNDDDEINPDKIYTELYVQYIANTDDTYVRATFHEEERSGTLVKLSGDAGIMVDNIQMQNAANDPWNYTAILSGYYDTLNVEYRDRDGNVYDYQIDVTQVNPIAFPGGFTNLDITEDHEIAWSGEPITQNEEKVHLEYGKTGMNFYKVSKNEVGANTITMESRNLMTYGASDIDALLYRNLDMGLNNTPPAGGSLILSYSTGRVPITLVFEN